MSCARVLHKLLANLERRVDPSRARSAAERHRAALDYVPLEAPPLVLHIPYTGKEFEPYPYAEAFDHPAKMMVNELLIGKTSIYHAVDIGGDTPCCLRPNFGTGIIASQFGAALRLTDDNMPWVEPIGEEKIHAGVQDPLPDVHAGLMPKVLEQYACFAEMLADYPRCREAFNITLPDLQGPFDTAAMLWGSGIFEALYTDGDLVHAWLERVARQMIAVYGLLAEQVRDQLHPQGHFQHAIGVKGKILIRDDSAVTMLSPAMYARFIRPVHERIAAALGNIGIHFCGNGQHQIDNLLETTGLSSLDFGQAQMMDMDRIYEKAAPRRVPLSRVTVPQEQLVAARLQRRFPCGVLLAAPGRTPEHARTLLDRYLTEA